MTFYQKKKKDTKSVGKVVGKRGNLMYCWWGCKVLQSLWKTVWSFLKKIKDTTTMHVCMLCCFSCVRFFCDSMDCSAPGSSVYGILQARILEWVAIFFSRDLPDPGIKPKLSALQADSLPSEPPGRP